MPVFGPHKGSCSRSELRLKLLVLGHYTHNNYKKQNKIDCVNKKLVNVKEMYQSFGCGGCHTSRGGQFCQFTKPLSKDEHAGVIMASIEEEVPDRDRQEYEAYLARKITEEEERLQYLKDKTRMAEMESQLAGLRLQTAEMDRQSETHMNYMR